MKSIVLVFFFFFGVFGYGSGTSLYIEWKADEPQNTTRRLLHRGEPARKKNKNQVYDMLGIFKAV